MAQQIALEIVELYPYVECMKYLLAGSVALAMYVAVMFDLLFLVAFGIAALAFALPCSSAPSSPAAPSVQQKSPRQTLVYGTSERYYSYQQRTNG